MNSIFKALVLVAALVSSQAFAAYSKIAECTGVTDKNIGASAYLFVNQANDTVGIIVYQAQGEPVQISDTAVDWTSNPQGFPRFFDNDYDLDIVINDATASVDDILVGDSYVSQLNCVYKPNL